MFFVAITRTKETLWISYSQKDFVGKAKEVSCFWHELPEENITIQETNDIEKKTKELLPIFLKEKNIPSLTSSEKKILEPLVKKFVWSSSSLQAFLDCPSKFLYQYLLKIPSPPQKNLSYGQAIHASLEDLLKEFSKSKVLKPVDFLLKQFELRLRELPMEIITFNDSLTHGKKILIDYYEAKCFSITKLPKVLLEFNFKKFGISIDNIPITGKLDKIEFLNNDLLDAIIVDYKSGKSKPINNKDNIWRQFVFYDLLCRNTKNLQWKTQKFIAEFLTPDTKKGFIRSEIFINEDDRITVLEELRQAHESILSLKFPIINNIEIDSEINYWQSFRENKNITES